MAKHNSSFNFENMFANVSTNSVEAPNSPVEPQKHSVDQSIETVKKNVTETKSPLPAKRGRKPKRETEAGKAETEKRTFVITKGVWEEFSALARAKKITASAYLENLIHAELNKNANLLSQLQEVYKKFGN